MIRPREGEAYVFSKVVHSALGVVEVERNCTSVGKTNLIIALKAIDLVGAREYNLDLEREKQHRAK